MEAFDSTICFDPLKFVTNKKLDTLWAQFFNYQNQLLLASFYTLIPFVNFVGDLTEQV
jgi:hypothetical protein